MFEDIKTNYKNTESPYNPEFVEKIRQSMADKKAEKGRRVSVEEFKQLYK
ncbi:MAG: hypothetical protein LBE36_02325 [Flavobacteriaceae bacterium]|jgi:hypothetical protein|nr:hypothetical protein [Flavobacteriaceae bacterium]